LIQANKERINVAESIADAVARTDVTFVVVPTPSDVTGGFSVQYAEEAFRDLGAALAKKNDYHLVVMTSTVLPGATRAHLLRALEDQSGLRCGPDFGLCYSPEFIALGSVIRDFLNPDFLLIGEFDERSGSILESFYKTVTSNGAPAARMSIENAELAKVSLNAYVTMKITFANMLAKLCERIPNGDVDAVTGALGLDKRIGRHYLVGGLGFGGPCFPRDNVALAAFADSIGVDVPLARATHDANLRIPQELVSASALERRKVAVLGISYKVGSHVIEESQGLAIARYCAHHANEVALFDPLMREMQLVVERPSRVAVSLEDAVPDADIVIVANRDPFFNGLPSILAALSRPVTVIDVWRTFRSDLNQCAHVTYRATGVGYATTTSPATRNVRAASRS